MDTAIRRLVNNIAAAAPGLESVWLIGSRANGTAKVSSDWDFIAFGVPATLEFLRQSTALHRSDVDFLVVTNGNDFEAAWGEIEKHGSLSEWRWREVNAQSATYMQHKWVDQEDGAGVRVTDVQARKVWPE